MKQKPFLSASRVYLILHAMVNLFTIFFMLQWEAVVTKFYPGTNAAWATMAGLTFTNFVSMILEVPTGVLSDKWGHHRVVHCGMFSMFLSGLLIWLGCVLKPETYFSFWLTFGGSVMAYTLVFTFLSGALNSWVIEKSGKDAVLKLGFKESLVRSLLWLVLGSLWLYRTPSYLFIGPTFALLGFVSFVFAFFIVTPTENCKEQKVSFSHESGNVKEALKELFGEWKLLRVLIAINTMYGIAFLGTYFWKIPLAKAFHSSSLLSYFSLSVPQCLSLFFTVFMLLRCLLLLKPELFIKRSTNHDFPWAHVFLIALCGVAFGIGCISNQLSLLWISFLFVQGCVSLSQPRLMGLFHWHIEKAHNRATLESLLSLSLAPIQLLILVISAFASMSENIVGMVFIIVSLLCGFLIWGTWLFEGRLYPSKLKRGVQYG